MATLPIPSGKTSSLSPSRQAGNKRKISTPQDYKEQEQNEQSDSSVLRETCDSRKKSGRNHKEMESVDERLWVHLKSHGKDEDDEKDEDMEFYLGL